MLSGEEKLFPHPVWRTDGDDYVKGEILVEWDNVIDPDKRELVVEASFNLEADPIAELVKRGSAKCSVTVHSRETFRGGDVIQQEGKWDGSSPIKVRKAYPPTQLGGEVICEPLIVAWEDISSYASDDFHSEWGEEDFSFKKGDVIAVLQPEYLDINPGIWADFGSIFVFREELGGALELAEKGVDVSGNLIEIRVQPGEQYQLLGKASKNEKNNTVMMAGIYEPVLLQVLSLIRIKEEGEYGDRLWYQVIERLCEDANIALRPDNPDELIENAQRLLNRPLVGLNEYFRASEEAE